MDLLAAGPPAGFSFDSVAANVGKALQVCLKKPVFWGGKRIVCLRTIQNALFVYVLYKTHCFFIVHLFRTTLASAPPAQSTT